jgi:hypothetical protein
MTPAWAATLVARRGARTRGSIVREGEIDGREGER